VKATAKHEKREANQTDEHKGEGIGGVRSTDLVNVAKELAGLTLSVLLFYLAFPNDISYRGFGFLGFIALLPLIWTINRTPLWRLFLYGPLTGFATYALFNIWLVNFHPMAIFIVPVIYATYYLLLMPLMKLPVLGLGRHAWIAQVLIWLGYEYLRTQGFLGYAYGIIGYTQYLFIPLVNFAEYTGVWGISLIVIAPQFFVAQLAASGKLASIRSRWIELFRRYRYELAALMILMWVPVLIGALSMVDYSTAPTSRMALVQQNVDPWIGGTRAYRASMDASIRQSRAALAEDPDLDMIVWSETSFIPAIEYHSRYRTDPERYELVDELLAYIDGVGIPFLLGNGDGQLYLNDEGEYERRDYNAVYLYRGRDDSQIYRKLHLVPFTEHFPYERQFPWLHRLLVENDTSFWNKGEEWTVFEVDGLKFSSPICFEDTFGYLSRGFVRRGADVIINLTNDSWSQSVPSATQHLAMAVFRATENRRTVVRSTNGGMTAVIDPNGRIIADNEPFTESYIIADVPVYTGRTGIYTSIGDVFAYLFLAGGGVSIIISLYAYIRRRASMKNQEN
jgi:apolipoprotein N-acyltransferase